MVGAWVPLKQHDFLIVSLEYCILLVDIVKQAIFGDRPQPQRRIRRSGRQQIVVKWREFDVLYQASMPIEKWRTRRHFAEILYWQNREGTAATFPRYGNILGIRADLVALDALQRRDQVEVLLLGERRLALNILELTRLFSLHFYFAKIYLLSKIISLMF